MYFLRVLEYHIYFSRCGNADKNILSVYCLKTECRPKRIQEEAICKTRLPHDSHGCIDGTLIDWKKAHNVRNFSASIDEHTACVWECKVRKIYQFGTFITNKIILYYPKMFGQI